MDGKKQILSALERQKATERRLKGEAFPKNEDMSDGFFRIINKACEFDPLKRFESPEQMKAALENIGNPNS